MTSKLTRERIEWLNYAATGLAANGTEMAMSPQDVIALTECCLDAMDGEPVVFTDERNLHHIAMGRETSLIWGKQNSEAGDVPLYRHVQPAPDREHVRREHAEWSQATFGNVGPVGPLKHLSEEALEAAAEPGDLSEWADMQFLMWDAQRRSGITDAQITQAMIDKLAVNKQREWPEPKDGEPRLHIKEQPAPVVMDERAAFNAWNNDVDCPLAGRDAKSAAWMAWNYRGMLQVGNSPVIPEGYVMVPKEPTPEMLAVINEAIKSMRGSAATYARVLAAAPQEVK